MPVGSVVVLDVGKTLAKISLWSPARELIERKCRPSGRSVDTGLPCLDYAGIEHWLAETLAEYGRMAEISAIVPVAHGAAACVVDDGRLVLAPLDYEAVPPDDIRQSYLPLRDPFAVTGSPCLPMGLNLGAQLFWLQAVRSEQFQRGRILTWAQYWAWRLSGVEAVEATSLGCHTDLWLPTQNEPSPMALSQGWAERFAPLRKASDVLGTVTQEWQERAGLPPDCKVLCGVHDSNAALLAARLHPEVAGRECTVLSTGTWFIAMRSVLKGSAIPQLEEGRDCLFNVDVLGNPVPSSRFMGGREAELLEAGDGTHLDVAAHSEILLRQAKRMSEAGVFALPAFEPGVGPYPKAVGYWEKRPDDRAARRAVAGLYLALMANVTLDLIGTTGRIVIEGRFAGDPVFTRALVSLRPKDHIYLSNAQDSLAFGALGLLDGCIPAQYEMKRVDPLDFDITHYAERWRNMVANGRA